MAKVILICGRICGGKTTYARKLRDRLSAVELSSDELMLRLFPMQLGDAHEETAARVNGYLMEKAAAIALAGANVILDWGFWRAGARRSATDFFRSRGIDVEWHYVGTTDAQWRENIRRRNASLKDGEYYVDDNLAKKCTDAFQMPDRSEMDVWYEY